MILLVIQWHKLVLKTDQIMTRRRNINEEQKHKLVEIDRQERRRGNNFMKRVKARWDTE